MSHVAMLIPTLDRIGGAERQVMLLARGLRSRGWRVSLVALAGNGGDSASALRAIGVGFTTLEMRKGLADPRGWLRLRGWLRRGKPDILHAHLPHAAWMARWSRLGAPVRVIVDTIHTSSTGTAGRRLGYRWSRWLPDAVTAVGEGVREAWVDARMVDPDRCIVVPNGVDLEVWRPDKRMRAEMRTSMGLGDEFLWFAAGRLEAVKDYATMLRAFAHASGTQLVIAGAGPLEAELRQLARELGIDNRVRFLGFVPDVRPWMQAADGFLLTSLWEGLPIGLMEAAACGLAAVATDVSGVREVVVDDETGWLASVGDAYAVAGRMNAVMALSQEHREAMGARARDHIVASFSLDAVLDHWEQFYRELLEANPEPRRWGAAGWS